MGGGSTGAGAGKTDDFWYDVGGWVVFTGIAFSWMVMAKVQQG